MLGGRFCTGLFAVCQIRASELSPGMLFLYQCTAAVSVHWLSTRTMGRLYRCHCACIVRVLTGSYGFELNPYEPVRTRTNPNKPEQTRTNRLTRYFAGSLGTKNNNFKVLKKTRKIGPFRHRFSCVTLFNCQAVSSLFAKPLVGTASLYKDRTLLKISG